MSLLKKIYIQVIIGVLVGILLGYLSPHLAVCFKPLSDIFIKMIKMLIAPIIFLTLASGLATINDMKKISAFAGGAFIFFMVISTIALMMGLGAAEYFKPGQGLNIDISSLKMQESQLSHPIGTVDLLVNTIPKTFVSAFVDGELLQVIVISILFSAGLILIGPKNQPIVQGMKTLAEVFFKIMHLVMYLAPLATFAAMAFSVGTFGIAPLRNLFGLLACYYLTSLAFIFFVLGSILQIYCKVNILHLLRYFKDELLIVWGTASSETVLPNIMEKLESLGCDKSLVGLVLPLGYSFNLAGTAIYLTMAAIFIAQATNTHLSAWQELSLLGVMIISSKGAAGVSGSGFIVLTSSLAAVGTIPVAGVVLVLGIDKFMNEARSIVNMMSNVIATIIISQWQHSFNQTKAKIILDPKTIAAKTALIENS